MRIKSVSVIIPTWQRVAYLRKALEGLLKQTRKADEVIVAIRKEDTLSQLEINEWKLLLEGLIEVVVEEPGVIAAMQAGVDFSTGDLVCLLDDDAVPHADWIERMIRGFEMNPEIGGIGGRDLLWYDLESGEAEVNLTEVVGVVRWFGRIDGNHHRGTGGKQRVDVLKGCNCAFRGDLIRRIGFEHQLRGSGAQAHWELALCSEVKEAGFLLSYDPAIQVIHYVGPREDFDQRGAFSEGSLYDNMYNQAFVIGKQFALTKGICVFLFSLLIGSRVNPGIVQWVRLILRGDRLATKRLWVSQRAFMNGYLKGRSKRS